MAGGAAALSSSLCSSVVSDCSDDRADAEDKADNSHVKDKDNGQHGNNPIESPKEAQDGTEFDAKKGLNLYDYGARHYDAALGRFATVDPSAENYFNTSQLLLGLFC